MPTDNEIIFGIPRQSRFESLNLPPPIEDPAMIIESEPQQMDFSDPPAVTKGLSLEPLPREPSKPLVIEPSPLNSILASKLLPNEQNRKIPVIIDNETNEVQFIPEQELIEIIEGELGESGGFDNDEEAMNALQEYHRNAMNDIENSNSELQETLMLSAEQKFHSLGLPRESLAEAPPPPPPAPPLEENYAEQVGGRVRKKRPVKPKKEFVHWEQRIMQCSLESTIVSTLTWMWVPEWLAKQIAWYTAAFFRGVVGVTWAIIKSIFGFIWNNKIGLVLYLLSFSSIIQLFKPIAPIESPGDMLENKWTTAAREKTVEILNKLGVATENNMAPILVKGQIGEQYGKEIKYLTEEWFKHKGDTLDFPAKIHNVMYQAEKLKDWNIGLAPTTELPIVQSVFESYNYFLGGQVANSIGFIRTGIEHAILVYKYGAYLPGVTKYKVEIPDRIIPDFVYQGSYHLFNVPSIESLLTYISTGLFVLKTAGYALDLGSRLWNEVGDIQWSCANKQQIDPKRVKQNIKKHIQQSRFLMR